MHSSEPAEGLGGQLWLIVSAAVSGWILYLAFLAVYRISIHPLANLPGPKLAAATYLYEFWYDVVLWGRYTRKISQLHETYGPIIRINPDEVHCNDPAFIDSVYPGVRSRRDKSNHFLRNMPSRIHSTLVGSEKHDTHRQRRRTLDKFFSKAQTLKLEDLIRHSANKLCDKLLATEENAVVNVSYAYASFTADIIMATCFGDTAGFLDHPGWAPNYQASINILFGFSHIWRFCPLLATLMQIFPLFIVKRVSKDMGMIMEDLKVMLPNKIEQTKSVSTVAETTRPTMFSVLLEDPSIPASEKTTERLAVEGNAMIVGGTEAPAMTLAIFTYHVLDNPDILQKLHAEITAVAPDERRIPDWQVLEKLPYLSAVVTEALRLVFGVAGRLPRVAPEDDVLYSGSWTPRHSTEAVSVSHTIPRGYALGMSAYLVHTNETLFPEPLKFRPQRWLDDTGRRDKTLEKYLLSFSKGSRQCIGQQMAYAEIYVCTAALVLRVLPHMRICGTTNLDLDYDHDEFIGKSASKSKGVMVTMSRASQTV